MKKRRAFQRSLLLFLLLWLLCQLCACGGIRVQDPFYQVRGDFDAEISWSLMRAEDGVSRTQETTWTAAVQVRDGLITMRFSAPESMAGMEVAETSQSTVTVRKDGKLLTGTAFGQYLQAARLLTETGTVTQRTDSADGATLTYLVPQKDGGSRTRTMLLDADARPRMVTDPGYTTVRVVWFEPVGEN